jgi:hypothetical protein
MEPLSPAQKWRAITIATVVLVPAFWTILIGLVAGASDEPGGVSNPAAFVAFGLALVPFVFVALAFLSGHPRAASATARAMGLCLLVGIPISALAGDGITGMVAGVGAGGALALRPSDIGTGRARAAAVAVATVYTFFLAHTAGALVLLAAPVFPFTALGLADHLAERRAAQASQALPRG